MNLLFLGKKETLSEDIFLIVAMLLFSIIIPIGIFGIESLMEKIFPGLNDNQYRHIIKSLETGNAELFVKEVKRIEDGEIKYKQRTGNNEFFRFCKAYLLTLTNNVNEAQKILESLKITIRKRFALRGEIDFLLAEIYSIKNDKIKSLKFLKEAKLIFEKNNITEPIRLINEKINI